MGCKKHLLRLIINPIDSSFKELHFRETNLALVSLRKAIETHAKHDTEIVCYQRLEDYNLSENLLFFIRLMKHLSFMRETKELGQFDLSFLGSDIHELERYRWNLNLIR